MRRFDIENVRKLIADLEHERNRPIEDAEPPARQKEQVNLRLHGFSIVMLDRLAERYDSRRGTLGAQLLSAAIADAWAAADLGDPTEDEDVRVAWTEFLKDD